MPSPKNLKDSFPRILQDTLSPHFQGIIWITSQPFSSRPHPFDALNYFFDGILAKNLDQSSSHLLPRQNIFFSHSFGDPFFLVHVGKNVDKKNLKGVFDVIKGIKRKKDKILVLEESHSDKIEQFKKICSPPVPEFISLRLNR